MGNGTATRDRVLRHDDGQLESRVHLCPLWDGTWPHHIELHLYSTGPLSSEPHFMGMLSYSAADARQLAALLLAAADDLDR